MAVSTKKKTTGTVKLLWFGLGGHHADYLHHNEGGLNYSNCALSGYDRPENWPTRPIDDSDLDYPDGTPVINKRPILEERPGLAWSMPMCSVHLEPGHIDRCPMPSGAMVAGLEGSFQTMAALKAANPKFTGLDHVDVETYVNLWREEGAPIGHIQDGSIVWED